MQMDAQRPQKRFEPPPPPKKKCHSGRGGGWRGQNRKIHWGIILAPKLVILHGSDI